MRPLTSALLISALLLCSGPAEPRDPPRDPGTVLAVDGSLDGFRGAVVPLRAGSRRSVRSLWSVSSLRAMPGAPAARPAPLGASALRRARATVELSSGSLEPAGTGLPRMFVAGRRLTRQAEESRPEARRAPATPALLRALQAPPERDAVAAGSAFAMRHSGGADGAEVVDVVLEDSKLSPFMNSVRASEDDAGRAGGRVVEASAGLQLRPTPEWALRLALSQEFIHAWGEGDPRQQVSLGVLRRF